MSIKIISRGKGKSAVAAAAYRAGEKITNERTGIIHDYTRKKGVARTEIMLPEHAPVKYKDRATLWNAVEKVEKASNSQLAREIELALPKELSFSENCNLVREYIQKNFVDHGMIADVAFHQSTSAENPHCHILLSMRPFNKDGTWGEKQRKVYHLDENGDKIYDPKKRTYKCSKEQTTDWNKWDKAEEWRASWAEVCNSYLEKCGHDERIDHRSYERQGIEQIPTIHLGTAAHYLEQRGIRTERGDINREIEIANRKLREMDEQLSELRRLLAEVKELEEADVEQSLQHPMRQSPTEQQQQSQEIVKQAPSQLPQEPTRQALNQQAQKFAPQKSNQPSQKPVSQKNNHLSQESSEQIPTLPPHKPAGQKPQPQPQTNSKSKAPSFSDVISDILARQQGAVVSSKVATEIVEFLESHKQIKNYDDLENYQKRVIGQQRETSDKLTGVQARLEEVKEYFKEYEAYKRHRENYHQYQKEYDTKNPWSKKSFAKENQATVDNYEQAKSGIDILRDKNGKIPINAWQREFKALNTELLKLKADYGELKNEFTCVNKVRIAVYDVLRKEEQREMLVKDRSKGR